MVDGDRTGLGKEKATGCSDHESIPFPKLFYPSGLPGFVAQSEENPSQTRVFSGRSRASRAPRTEKTADTGGVGCSVCCALPGTICRGAKAVNQKRSRCRRRKIPRCLHRCPARHTHAGIGAGRRRHCTWGVEAEDDGASCLVVNRGKYVPVTVSPSITSYPVQSNRTLMLSGPNSTPE